jgi:hypothetical protein
MPNPRLVRVCVGLCLAAAIPIGGAGQEPTEGIGGPLTHSTVFNAPFSADATTTTRLTFSDGTKLAQSTTAHYYRDGMGRARVEFLMNGLAPATTMFERHIRTIIRPDPTNGSVRTLDAETRTAHYFPRAFAAYAAGGETEFAVPIGGVRLLTFRRAQDLLTTKLEGEPVGYPEARKESLGSRRIADVETIGSRVTMSIPAGQWRNDNPIELVDERWESSELKLLIAGRFFDSRTGEVEYRLANIRRAEPSPGLFEIPSDYRLDTTPETLNGGWVALMRAVSYTATRRW